MGKRVYIYMLSIVLITLNWIGTLFILNISHYNWCLEEMFNTLLIQYVLSVLMYVFMGVCQAVTLDPNFLDAYINLGNVLKEARIFDRSETFPMV